MRADRLISLILLLQQRGTLTAETLTAELEVSVRTIYRDITALSAAGIPVYATHGPGGGISLVDRYRTSLTGLSRDQARALLMFTLPEAAAALGLGAELQSALLKLTAALPASLQEDGALVRQRIFINLDAHTRPADVDRRLAELHQAVWEDRWAIVRYRSVLGERIPPFERRVMPLALAAQGSRWHLVCQLAAARLVIPAGRILDVQVSQETFNRPVDFDLPTFWQSWQVDHAAHRPAFAVHLRAAPQAVHLLKDRTTAGSKSPPTGDGWHILHVQFENLEEARQVLLALGSAVEILDPLALRLSVIDYARQILSLYEVSQG